jgi:hypothetical protein
LRFTQNSEIRESAGHWLKDVLRRSNPSGYKNAIYSYSTATLKPFASGKKSAGHIEKILASSQEKSNSRATRILKTFMIRRDNLFFV